jgi:choline dehydrogenase-like flavoprotein
MQFDAIVVGSGITGGWAAKELTERGLKVLMLERGRYIEHGKDYIGEHMPPWQVPFRGRPLRELYAREYPVQSACYAFDETTRHFWNNDLQNPYVVDKKKPFHWMRANVVGGRSLLWGRQVYRWSDLDFEANSKDGHGCDWPIRYADIKDWYSHVERFIGVSGQAEYLPHLPDGEFLPPMELTTVEKAVKQKIEAAFPGRKMTIGRVAVLTRAHNGRAPCHYCGVCHRGCSGGSYFSTLSSTLPAAMKTGLLTLQADSIVEKLDYDPITKRITGVRVVDAQTKARTTYTARLVFLCASTVGTIQILLNSRSDAFPNGLANRSGTLGRYLMDHTHPTFVMGLMPGYKEAYVEGLRPNGIYIPRFRNLAGQDADAQFIRGYGFQGGAFRVDWRGTAMQTAAFGADFKRSLREPGPWMFTLDTFGECLPYKDNRVELHSTRVDRYGIPQVSFDFEIRANERKMGEDAARQAESMLKAAGAERTFKVDLKYVGGDAIHEMGGARMGHDPRESVLNAWNQAHDVPNLFVTDGSCMTSSSCVNPSITYMALTARAVNYAVRTLNG